MHVADPSTPRLPMRDQGGVSEEVAFDKGPERAGIGFVEVEEAPKTLAGSWHGKDDGWGGGRGWAQMPGKEASVCGSEGR